MDKFICTNNCNRKASFNGLIDNYYFYAGRIYDIKKIEKEKDIPVGTISNYPMVNFPSYSIFVDYDVWLMVDNDFIDTNFICNENTLMNVDSLFNELFFKYG